MYDTNVAVFDKYALPLFYILFGRCERSSCLLVWQVCSMIVSKQRLSYWPFSPYTTREVIATARRRNVCVWFRVLVHAGNEVSLSWRHGIDTSVVRVAVVLRCIFCDAHMHFVYTKRNGIYVLMSHVWNSVWMHLGGAFCLVLCATKYVFCFPSAKANTVIVTLASNLVAIRCA